MKRYVFFFFLFSLLLIPLTAQSNEILDSVLAEKQLSAGSAAYILLSIESPEVNKGEAFTRLSDSIELAKYGIKTGNDSVSLGLFAYLLQQQLELPRGFLSVIFSGPRYSLRDLRFLGIIQLKGDASSGLSGEDALRITGRALTELEERI